MRTMLSREVVIVGAGPAGLSAAIEAGKYGADVLVLDENHLAGGQLFKQIHKFFGSAAHQAGVRGFEIGNQLIRQAESCGVEIWLNAIVWGLFDTRILGVIHHGQPQMIETKKIIVATGAVENPLAFRGWTLPGVMGAGAAQTMINVHRVLPGKRFLMVGSGNVGLIVSYQLIQAGGRVTAVVEAMPQIGGYGVHAAKIRRADVPILTRHTIKKALGKERVEAAVIVKVDKKFGFIPGTEKTVKVDTICIAAGLRPRAELCEMAGCRFDYMAKMGGFVPVHNKNMEATVSGIYVVGDAAGVEEANTAMEEGRLAGISVAETLGHVDVDEAHRLKREIDARLASLRLGTFGHERKKAKIALMRRWGAS